MKKLMALFIASLVLCGCALSTIKPYKKTSKAAKPAKKAAAETVEAPAPAVMIREAAVEETKEEVVEIELDEEIK